MEYRPLDITLISAKDLNDVNLFSKMDVYAIVYLSNDPRSKQKTHVDKDGGKSPTWNFLMKFNVPDQSCGPPVVLHIQLRSDRSLGDRDIGEVQIPIKDLLNTAGLSSGDGKSCATQFVSYQVRKPSGMPKGILYLSFKFGEKVSVPIAAAAAAATPVLVAGFPVAYGYSRYPPPPGYGHPLPPAAYGHPLPPAAYGHPPPPPAYGYPLPPAAYGYLVHVDPPPRGNNNLWMGLLDGPLGRVAGQFLIGKMTSDSSDAYVAGYDAGFDGGGSFDF